MLTIRRHFPINKLMLTRVWLSVKDFWRHVGVDAWRYLQPVWHRLQQRFPHLSRRMLVSLLVVLVGFFGSLAAFVGLRPATNQGVANPGGAGLQATSNAVAPSTVASPVSSQPSQPTVSAPSATTESGVGSSPVWSAAGQAGAPSAPVVGAAPTASTFQPGMGSVTPSGSESTTTSAPTSTTPVVSQSSPPPITTAPLLQSTVDSVQQALPPSTGDVTDPVLNTAGNLLNLP